MIARGKQPLEVISTQSIIPIIGEKLAFTINSTLRNSNFGKFCSSPTFVVYSPLEYLSTRDPNQRYSNMSFTVTTDRDGRPESLKFRMTDDDASSERVLSLLRSGYLLDGGFLQNDAKEIVFEIKAGGHYHYVDFKRRKTDNPFEGALPAAPAIGDVAPKFQPNIVMPKPVTIISRPDVHVEHIQAKPKKVKKVRDPLAPKKPLSAYLLYTADHQAGFKTSYPDLNPKELMTVIGKSWTALNEKTKVQYFKRSTELRDEYNRQMRIYIEKFPDSPLSKQFIQEEAALRRKEARMKAAAMENIDAMHHSQFESLDEGGEEDEDDQADLEEELELPVFHAVMTTNTIPVVTSKVSHSEDEEESKKVKKSKDKSEKKESKSAAVVVEGVTLEKASGSSSGHKSEEKEKKEKKKKRKHNEEEE